MLFMPNKNRKKHQDLKITKTLQFKVYEKE